jgi:hypothetical protein
LVINLSKLAVSDYAAWWGAIIATLALVWNIIVAVRAGARLHVTATPNMQIFPLAPGEEDRTYIHVNAINRGNSATTITHFCGYRFDNLWDLIRNKKQHFIVNGTSDGLPVPYKLAPGDEWRGIADQVLMLKDFKGKYFYIGVIHNQGKKPIYKRVKLNA